MLKNKYSLKPTFLVLISFVRMEKSFYFHVLAFRQQFICLDTFVTYTIHYKNPTLTEPNKSCNDEHYDSQQFGRRKYDLHHGRPPDACTVHKQNDTWMKRKNGDELCRIVNNCHLIKKRNVSSDIFKKISSKKHLKRQRTKADHRYLQP